MQGCYLKTIIGVLSGMLYCVAHAAMPIFSITASSKETVFPAQVLSSDVETSYYATYTVRNNLSTSTTFAFVNHQPLLSEVSTEQEGYCAAMQSLASNQTCILRLKLTIPADQPNITVVGGPVVCRSARYPVACSQAIGVDAINTVVSHSLLTFGLDASGAADPSYRAIVVTNNTAAAQSFTNLSSDSLYSNIPLSGDHPKVNLEFCGQEESTCQGGYLTDNCHVMPLAVGDSCKLWFHVISDGAGDPVSASVLTLNLTTADGGHYTHLFGSNFSPVANMLYAGGISFNGGSSHAADVWNLSSAFRHATAKPAICSAATDAWRELGGPSSPASYEIRSLFYDNATGTLYAGGSSQEGSGPFSGALWTSVNGQWQEGVTYPSSTQVNALSFFNNNLYMAGNYYLMSTPLGFVNSITQGSFSFVPYSYEINGISTFNGQLYATGDIRDSGSGHLTHHLWQYSSNQWTSVASLSNFNAYSMMTSPDGEQIYLGGGDAYFHGKVMAWDGVSWSSMGTPPDSYEIRGLAPYDGCLYAAGTSRNPNSGALTSHLWVYDGDGTWSDLGNPWSNGFIVLTLAKALSGGLMMVDPSLG